MYYYNFGYAKFLKRTIPSKKEDKDYYTDCVSLINAEIESENGDKTNILCLPNTDIIITGDNNFLHVTYSY